MKCCRDCKNTKSFNEFLSSSTCKDGFRPECRTCYNSSQRIRYEKEKEQRKQQGKTYRENNVDKIRARYRKYYDGHKNKIREKTKAYRVKNRGKWNAYYTTRRLKKIQRTPKWLTKEQLEEIHVFYNLAIDLAWLSEEPLEVDHIIPLHGRLVSGLHVPWNLQILPKSINASKSNKF